MAKNGCTYSAVLPVYNEDQGLKNIILRINAVFEKLGEPYEIICIDDGSTDGSWTIIEELHKSNPRIKGIKFQRNFGHQLSIFAGIRHTSGDYIAVLDADGQDPPEILPQFFSKCREGFDVVYAIRKNRKEGFFKKLCYKIFYLLYSKIVPFSVPLDSGDFAVISRKVADFMRSLSEKTPFVRGLRSWHGGKQIGIEYDREERLFGQPKYNYYKLFFLAINAFVSFSKFPLRVISLLGISISFFSFLFGIGLIILKLTINIDLVGWTSLAILIIFFGGLNLFVLGIIGEYIGNIFDEVKGRPVFLIEKTIGAVPSYETVLRS